VAVNLLGKCRREENLFVRQSLRNLHGPDISVGYAKILGLPDGKAAMGIAKQNCRWVAAKLSCFVLFGFERSHPHKSSLAKETLAGCNRERHNDRGPR
jgi:hypothetical protein